MDLLAHGVIREDDKAANDGTRGEHRTMIRDENATLNEGVLLIRGATKRELDVRGSIGQKKISHECSNRDKL